MKEMMEKNGDLSNLDALANNLNRADRSSKHDFSRSSRMTQDLVYGIQENIANRIFDTVEPNKGYRIAMTQNAIRDSLNTHELIFGTLRSTSVSNGIVILDNLLEPQIIANLLFVVDEDIFPTENRNEILKKTHIASSIEILDSSIKNWFPKCSVANLIEKNSITGQVVMGNPIKIDSTDFFENIKVSLTCDGELVDMNHYKESDDNPLNALNLLINRLGKQGQFLKKGMIITVGSYQLSKALYRGEYHANFGILGNISLRVR